MAYNKVYSLLYDSKQTNLYVYKDNIYSEAKILKITTDPYWLQSSQIISTLLCSILLHYLPLKFCKVAYDWCNWF
jgi:hypothetical protein